jgi:hypothetical protein
MGAFGTRVAAKDAIDCPNLAAIGITLCVDQR